MKRNHKIFFISLALGLVLSFGACGDTNGSNDPDVNEIKDTIVTVEEWENALNFNFTNFEYKQINFSKDDNTTATIIIKVDGDVAYEKRIYASGTVRESYYTTKTVWGYESPIYYEHYKENGEWKKMMISSLSYQKTIMLTKGFPYDAFAYDSDTGIYKADEVIYDDISFTDVEISFLDNKMVSLQCVVDDVLLSCSANYDCVEVELYNQN